MLATIVLSQVKLVEDVCIGYLLELKLTAEQVSQLMQLWDKLMLYEARKQMLQTHANKAWTGGVMQTLPVLFEKLVHAGPREIELCKEVLFAAECGALCELQATRLALSHTSVSWSS